MNEPRVACAVPAPGECRVLRLAAGLSPMNPSSAAVGLPARWRAVSLRVGDGLVGTGRMVGDGALFLQVSTSPCGRTGSGAGLAGG